MGLKGIKTIIIGHEHPAVSIHEGVRTELFKCFLKGKFKGRILIVQPSFNLVTEGTDVLKEELLSPFLQQELSDFECFIVAEDSKASINRNLKIEPLSNTLYFGKIQDLVTQ
jgi:metallophosphoesterase superfamily enzyme